MVAIQPIEPMQMSESDYLAFEETSEIKHEFRQGQVYAMSGASVRHNTIKMNVGTRLTIQLVDRDCTVNSSDTRVNIASKQSYRYPDIVVFCGDPAYVENRTDTISNPVLLVEVLSPSTALQDRNEKLEEYLQIESLQAYLLVSQDAAKVERFIRHDRGEWLYSYATGLESEITRPDLDCTLQLATLYHKVMFDPIENRDN